MLQNYGKIPNSPLVYVPKGLLDSTSWKSYHQVNLPVHNGNMPASEKHALKGRLFKIRIKIWYKKWCYIGVFKLLIFNTLIYKIVL